MEPTLEIDIRKIEHNTRCIAAHVHRSGGTIFGVTKVFGGNPTIARAMIEGGVDGLADSRLVNIRRMRASGIDVPMLLVRSPLLSEVDQVVAQATTSLNSEKEVLVALSTASLAQGVTHQVILMTDLGDGREGVDPLALKDLVDHAQSLAGLTVAGIGVNLACFSGVIPTITHMEQLIALADTCGLRGQAMVLSGGNSSALPLLFTSTDDTSRMHCINHWRIGESIFFGWDILTKEPLKGCYGSACILLAEVIELQLKPSITGKISWQAIVALGTQEIGTGMVTPVLSDLVVVGVSSDHLALAVPCEGVIQVGDILQFYLDYPSLMATATCPYVVFRYVKKLSNCL